MQRLGERLWRSCCAVIALCATILGVDSARGQTDSQVALPMGAYFYANNSTYTDGSVYVWPTDTPANHGLSASTLASAGAQLGGMHKSASLLVVRDAKLVHESYFHGALASQAKNIHSASKSILSTLVGIAIDEGQLSIDTPIGAVLPHAVPATKQSITVENLLTMTSGIRWFEDNTEYELEQVENPNFIQQILDLPQDHAPGATFNYSTGDAYLLSAVLTHATGQSLHQFGKQRLFDPLGIDVERWGRDNQGYFSGGFNFFITPREMAAFGQLVLDGGAKNGQQIVPAEWLAAATSPQGETDAYGYMWWTDVNLAGHDGFRAWGWGKQFIYVFPDLDMVVTITHDTNGGGVQDTDLNSFVRDYVLAALVTPLDGDFNHDGVVDAADYTEWRNNFGSPYTNDDYLLWKRNYGRSNLGAGSGSLAASAVPEPSSVMLLAIVAGLFEAGRRGLRSRLQSRPI